MTEKEQLRRELYNEKYPVGTMAVDPEIEIALDIVFGESEYGVETRCEMTKEDFMYDLLRYGKIKADFEVKDNMGRLFRARVFEYQEKKYFTVMVDGEPLELKEV